MKKTKTLSAIILLVLISITAVQTITNNHENLLGTNNHEIITENTGTSEDIYLITMGIDDYFQTPDEDYGLAPRLAILGFLLIGVAVLYRLLT